MASEVHPDSAEHDPNIFSIIAVHDLKEPVHGIRAYCESLIEDYHHCLDDDGRRRMRKLVQLCERLDRMIGDVVNYGRTAYESPSFTEVDLHVLVQEILELMEPSLVRRGAMVRVVERLPIVRGDPTMLGLVLTNLISNGLKFNRNPSPCVEIGLSAASPPTICVRDNGIGIAREHHEAIFGLFKRLHSRSTYEGSGAGLSIVRKIVHAHGGRIWLESEPDLGTTFHFTLGSAVTKRRRQQRHRLDTATPTATDPPAVAHATPLRQEASVTAEQNPTYPRPAGI